MPTIYQIIVLALIAAFIVLVMSKTETRYKLCDWCDEKGFKQIAKMFDCDFCFGFWSAVVVAIVITIVTADVGWLISPILSAPITRFLV